MIDLILPNWHAPPWIRALTTCRRGGVSAPPYDGLNLGDHVGDDPECVAANRRLLRQRAALPAEPRWLCQVHGCEVAQWNGMPGVVEADAAATSEPGVVCAVLTADCLPLLLCNENGSRVAVAHAGWRGLVNGVVEAAVAAFDDESAHLMVWLGPAIGPSVFEVGDEVRDMFLDAYSEDNSCFKAHGEGHWLADIYRLASNRLTRLGIGAISGGNYCTYTDSQRFFSYRRDGKTGRMVSLIWIEEQSPKP